jgi:HlyD family secretion protein
MNKRIMRIAAVLLIVGIAIITAVVVIRGQSGTGDKVRYQTARVGRSTVTNSVSATGVLQPLTLVDVKSNVGGAVEKLAVDLGDFVKKGDLIARIDPTDSRAQLEQAQANLSRDQARLAQARQNATLQAAAYQNGLKDAQQQLLSAQARLRTAQQQADVQPSLTASAIAQAQAGVSAAQEALRQLDAATIPQARTQAEANLRQATSNRETARKDLERQQELLAKGFVPAATVDTAKSQYAGAGAAWEMAQRKAQTVEQEYAAERDAARARLAQAEAQLQSARANDVQDDIRRDEVRAAQAAVAQAQANLALARANQRQIDVRQKDVVAAQAAIVSSKAALVQAQTNMGFTTISAPRDGVVLQRFVEEGTVIASARSSSVAGTDIVQLADISRMFVVANVDETDIGSIEVGQTVEITVDAYPSKHFAGKVTRIDPQAKLDQNVTMIPVTVQIAKADRRLKPAMNATCEFILYRHANVLTVPNEAVHEEDGAQTVTVLEAGRPVPRPVEVGIAGPEATEIREGVREGETVVTRVIQPEGAGGNRPNGPGGVPSPFGGSSGGRR